MTLPPAVAVMAKVPGAAPVESQLHGALTPERATELSRCFLLDRLDALAGVGDIARVVAITPPEGDTLDARLTRLFARLLAEDHAGAIAVDSDSPTLPMAYVAEAARTLAVARADGGYYLIGVRAPQPALFDGVPWSSPDTRRATLDRARALGLSVSLLPPWFDVDTAADLARRGS